MIEFNSNWNFKEVIENLKTLKTYYDEVLSSFYYFDLRKLIKFKKKMRDSVYSLNLQEWQKDKIWNYMNGYECYEELVKFI